MMAMRGMTISKIEAAERQLKQAIRMVIQKVDPVPVHTLSCSAHQILYDLARKRKIVSNLKDIVSNRKKREWINILNTSYNFFRHADKDIHEEIEFDPTISHFFILDATHLYQQLRHKLFYEGAIFRLWFNKKYPEFVIHENANDLLPHVVQMYGHFFTDEDFTDYLDLIDKYNLKYIEEGHEHDIRFDI